MNYYGTYYTHGNQELYHFGVSGMKWGVRKDGKTSTGSKSGKSSKSSDDKAARKAKTVKAIKIGAAVAGAALVAYGAYKLPQYAKSKSVEIGEAKLKKTLDSPLNKWNAVHDRWKEYRDSARSTLDRVNKSDHYSKADHAQLKSDLDNMGRMQSLMGDLRIQGQIVDYKTGKTMAEKYGTSSNPVGTKKAIENILEEYKLRR